MNITEKRILEYLKDLYGDETAAHTWRQIERMLADFKGKHPHLVDQGDGSPLSEIDGILITYGDQFLFPGQAPLKTLRDFYRRYLADTISTIHILPFYPYSSDDGFSVIDYRQVDPNLGTWDDITALNQHCNLMFDAVINHISSQSEWFQGFLRGEQPYQDYFIIIGPNTDLSEVVRPRTSPLLTPFETSRGTRYVWTTFSDDQVDLNYSNPQVLIEVISVLLFYIEQHARIIRLDAIAFLWKETGTSCIHLPETHRVIKLLRAVLDLVAPGVILISETNVPHEENITYFGSLLPSEERRGIRNARGDEAQMVYQFPLAPLVLHTFLTGDASKLSGWADSLKIPYPTAAFFNFIASHDGIGVRPTEGILSSDEVQALVDQTLEHGGLVSYKTNPDGSRSVYELNITLYDALNDPSNPQLKLDVQRFLASQAIMLSLAGIPGIYVHSLFGSRNCHPCVQDSGRSRSINRGKFQAETLAAELGDPNTITACVFEGYAHLLKIWREHLAFHPFGEQKILYLHDQVFAVLRTAPGGGERVLCLVNVSGETLDLSLDPLQLELPSFKMGCDLLSACTWAVREAFILSPYQVRWLHLR